MKKHHNIKQEMFRNRVAMHDHSVYGRDHVAVIARALCWLRNGHLPAA